MSITSKSPVRVAEQALAVGTNAFPLYAHRYSPKLYTQPQLFACLVLKTFFKTDYRGMAQQLRDLSDLRRTLGLERVPHFTTLQKAAQRLLRQPHARRVLRGTVRRFFGRRRRSRRVALDSSGFDCGHASRYFIRRRSRTDKPWKTVAYREKKRGHRTLFLPWRPLRWRIAAMPRTARASQGGFCYHVLNRGNGRRVVFHKNGDYAAFLKLLGEAAERTPVRLLAYCLMPNHFHLVLWPRADGDLSDYMMWLLTAHVRRYHQHYHSSGHVWQGRFRAFPIQEDDHLLTVLRYAERNALRAGLVKRAEDWRWSSASAARRVLPIVDAGPVPRPTDWLERLNQPQTEAEVEALRECLRRGRPFGHSAWMTDTAQRLGLEASLRPRGRPRKSNAPSTDLFGERAEDK